LPDLDCHLHLSFGSHSEEKAENWAITLQFSTGN
jgi:imidazolonepropionase-like amidohydrolase